MHDPDEATSFLITEIQDCLEKSKKVLKTKSNKRYPRKDWITNAIMISCKKGSNCLWKCAIGLIIITKLEYKDYIKRLDKIINEAKITYEKNLIKNNINNAKHLWKYIKNKMITNLQKDKTINKITLNKNCTLF